MSQWNREFSKFQSQYLRWNSIARVDQCSKLVFGLNEQPSITMWPWLYCLGLGKFLFLLFVSQTLQPLWNFYYLYYLLRNLHENYLECGTKAIRSRQLHSSCYFIFSWVADTTGPESILVWKLMYVTKLYGIVYQDYSYFTLVKWN